MFPRRSCPTTSRSAAGSRVAQGDFDLAVGPTSLAGDAGGIDMTKTGIAGLTRKGRRYELHLVKRKVRKSFNPYFSSGIARAESASNEGMSNSPSVRSMLMSAGVTSPSLTTATFPSTPTR